MRKRTLLFLFRDRATDCGPFRFCLDLLCFPPYFLFSLVVLFKSGYDFFTVFAEITKSCHTPCTYIICKLRERESEREGRGLVTALALCLFACFVHSCISFVTHLFTICESH